MCIRDSCAAAAAECDDPVKMGFVQALGVLIDTVVICSCTAFLMLLVPQEITEGLAGMDLLQTALQYHLGGFGVVFIAATLALFSFSTFLGVLYYARGNVAYLLSLIHISGSAGRSAAPQGCGTAQLRQLSGP